MYSSDYSDTMLICSDGNLSVNSLAVTLAFPELDESLKYFYGLKTLMFPSHSTEEIKAEIFTAFFGGPVKARGLVEGEDCEEDVKEDCNQSEPDCTELVECVESETESRGSSRDFTEDSDDLPTFKQGNVTDHISFENSVFKHRIRIWIQYKYALHLTCLNLSKKYTLPKKLKLT